MSEETAPRAFRKSILRSRRPPFIKPLSLDLSYRIPPEMIDVILEQLDFDTPTLAVCCLVCKTWLACSRHRLCPKISLDQWNARDFFHLLDSPHSTLSRGIRHISIQYTADVSISHRSHPGKPTGCRRAADRNVNSIVHPDEILPRLVSFVSLTSLCFSWIEYGLGPLGSISLKRSFPYLTDLEFRACTFPSFHEFTDIICGLQSLRHITLSDVEWMEVEVMSQGEHKPPPHLRTLELYIARISHVLDWLMLDRTMLSIETVKFGSAFWEGEDHASIGLFLRRLGPRLQHLTLPGHLPEGVHSYLSPFYITYRS